MLLFVFQQKLRYRVQYQMQKLLFTVAYYRQATSRCNRDVTVITVATNAKLLPLAVVDEADSDQVVVLVVVVIGTAASMTGNVANDTIPHMLFSLRAIFM